MARVTKLPSDPNAARLYWLRLALGYPTQKAFCEKLQVKPNTYNPCETGSRGGEATKTVVRAIRNKFGIAARAWLDDGDWGSLPFNIVRRLQELGAIPPMTAEPEPRRRTDRR